MKRWKLKFFLCTCVVSVLLTTVLLSNKSKLVENFGARRIKIFQSRYTTKPHIERDLRRTTEREEPLDSLHFLRKTTTKPPEVSHNAGPIPILLLTYMRSGSTFTGSVLHADSNVYYSFEPLHIFQSKIAKNESFMFLDGSTKYYDSFRELSDLVIRSLISCDFENMPITYLEDGFISYTSQRASFKKCMGSMKTVSVDLEKTKACLPLLTESCMSASHIVLKIIRSSMAFCEPIMADFPQMKIVHLLRDPRATLNSQLHAGLFKKPNLTSVATHFCNRIYEDILKANELKSKFPGRVMTVNYEDITKDAFGKTKELYDFAGLELTQSVKDTVESLTGLQIKNGKTVTDSATRSSLWRYSVKMTFIETVDNSCRQLYYKLGLREIPEEDALRNLTYDLRATPPRIKKYWYA